MLYFNNFKNIKNLIGFTKKYDFLQILGYEK